MGLELMTVADDEAVAFDGSVMHRWTGLRPGTEYERDGLAFRTLDRPAGECLSTVATVNDLHFGETSCGEGPVPGPVLRSQPGEPPYPEVMNRAAAEEVRALEPDLVVAKGDLTCRGAEDEMAAFRACWGTFGDRLLVVRGNHDGDHAAIPFQERWLAGVVVVLLDTTRSGHPGGQLSSDQLDRLDELAGRADRPVLAFGHHPVWTADAPPGYPLDFGLGAEDTQRLAGVVARRPRLVGWFAGHTHRNRVVHLPGCATVPFAEVSCVKDFPGGWAEYRVFEGGILQVFRRTSSPEALAWTERTRQLFGGLYPAYALGRLEDRCFVIPSRDRLG